MNSEVKEAWISALTSGEYEQGKNALCSIDAQGNKVWCCLGVLCDLAVKAGVQVSTTTALAEEIAFFGLTHQHLQGKNIVSYDGDAGYPPMSVVTWAGLDKPNPTVYPPGREAFGVSLGVLNDDGKSFAEIAEAIRESL